MTSSCSKRATGLFHKSSEPSAAMDGRREEEIVTGLTLKRFKSVLRDEANSISTGTENANQIPGAIGSRSMAMRKTIDGGNERFGDDRQDDLGEVNRDRSSRFSNDHENEEDQISDSISDFPTDTDASFEDTTKSENKNDFHETIHKQAISTNHSLSEECQKPSQVRTNEFTHQAKQDEEPQMLTRNQFLLQLEEQHQPVLEETQRKANEIAAEIHRSLLESLAEAKHLEQSEINRGIQLRNELRDVTEALKKVQAEIANVLHDGESS